MDKFNWCDFCQYDNDFDFDAIMMCDCCNQQYDEEPTNFIEKDSVTAYRKAVEVQNG